jgi:hypothetical protein
MPDLEESSPARMTVIMPSTLSMNLDLFCLKNRKGRGEVIREALAEYLTARKYKPDQIPQIRNSWIPVNGSGHDRSNGPVRRPAASRPTSTP